MKNYLYFYFYKLEYIFKLIKQTTIYFYKSFLFLKYRSKAIKQKNFDLKFIRKKYRRIQFKKKNFFINIKKFFFRIELFLEFYIFENHCEFYSKATLQKLEDLKKLLIYFRGNKEIRSNSILLKILQILLLIKIEDFLYNEDLTLDLTKDFYDKYLTILNKNHV